MTAIAKSEKIVVAGENEPKSTKNKQNQPVSTQINPYQPEPTCFNLYQPKNTRINSNQPVSTRIDPYQSVSTRINPNQPESGHVNPFQLCSLWKFLLVRICPNLKCPDTLQPDTLQKSNMSVLPSGSHTIFPISPPFLFVKTCLNRTTSQIKKTHKSCSKHQII